MVYFGVSGLRLLKDLGAAGSAAKAVFFASLHLVDFGVELCQKDARGFVLSVGSPKVAGVVKDNSLALKAAALHAQSPVAQELLDELAVVKHLVGSAQLRIFVFKCVKAVGAGGNYLLHAVSVEDFDVLKRLHLKEKLVASPSCGVARAALFSAEHGKRNSGLVQELGHGLGDFFGALVKATGASNPKEDFCGFTSCGQLGHGRYIQTHRGSLNTSTVAARLTRGLKVPVYRVALTIWLSIQW